MSSNLLKWNSIVPGEEEKRVIDSNRLVADRIALLKKVLETDDNREFSEDGFSEGLNAQVVDQLLAGSEEDGEGNVIREAPPQEPPAPDLEEINAEAQQIMDDAQAQAEQILANARAEAEAQKEAVFNEARQAGYDEGYAAGLQEVDSMKAELDGRAAELEQEFNERCEKLEPLFIETLTDIYEHIFHVQFADNKEIVFFLLQDALRKVDSVGSMLIHVSKEDYGFVSMQKKELLAGLSNADSTDIVEDMTLKPNECFIETGAGIFECSLETQLAGLKRELRLLSYQRPEEAE